MMRSTLRKAAVWGLMSAPWRVVRAMMNRAHPVRVFKPIPLFTKPHSFGTYSQTDRSCTCWVDLLARCIHRCTGRATSGVFGNLELAAFNLPVTGQSMRGSVRQKDSA